MCFCCTSTSHKSRAFRRAKTKWWNNRDRTINSGYVNPKRWILLEVSNSIWDSIEMSDWIYMGAANSGFLNGPSHVTWKMSPWKRVNMDPNHQFWGSMLNFRGVGKYKRRSLGSVMGTQIVPSPPFPVRRLKEKKRWRNRRRHLQNRRKPRKSGNNELRGTFFNKKNDGKEVFFAVAEKKNAHTHTHTLQYAKKMIS